MGKLGDALTPGELPRGPRDVHVACSLHGLGIFRRAVAFLLRAVDTATRDGRWLRCEQDFHEACSPCTVWAMYGLDASAVDPAAYSGLSPSVPSLIEDMAWRVCRGVRSE